MQIQRIANAPADLQRYEQQDMTKFEIKINIEQYEDLDKLALMAWQKDNYGNNGDWFSNFRGGL